jgi:hypothetical protein
MTTIIPKVSRVIQKAHTGQSAAIVKGKFVAFGKDSNDAGKKALKKGFRKKDIMIAYIMDEKRIHAY